jgi:putative sterol carrier protein
MAIFEDKNIAEELFKDLWAKMISDTDFGTKLKKEKISILYVIKNPDLIMFVDENGPLFGDEADAKTPVVTMKMDGDTVHKFWLKTLDLPKALATRKMKSKGPVAKVLSLIPLLKPGQAMYPDYCKKYDLPME